MESKITRIAMNIAKDKTGQVIIDKQVQDEIKENLKNVLNCIKQIDDKTVAKGCTRDIKETAALLGIRL